MEATEILLEIQFKPGEAIRPRRLVEKWKLILDKLGLYIKSQAYTKNEKNGQSIGVTIRAKPIKKPTNLNQKAQLINAHLQLDNRKGQIFFLNSNAGLEYAKNQTKE